MNLSTDSLKDAGLDLAKGVADQVSHLLYNRRAREALQRVESQQGATDGRERTGKRVAPAKPSR